MADPATVFATKTCEDETASPRATGDANSTAATQTTGGEGVGVQVPAAAKKKKRRKRKKKKAIPLQSNTLGATAPKTDSSLARMVEMEVPPMYTDQGGAVAAKRVSVPAHWRQYDIRPKHWGVNIVYMNAADPTFYEYELPSPSLIVWVLIQDFKGQYVKRRLYEEALLMNIQIKLVEPDKFELCVTREGVHSMSYRGEKLSLPDACVVRVGAVVDFFGLAVIRQLELLGVQMFNSVNSVLVSRDKLATYQTLSAAGVPVPKSVLSKAPVDIPYVVEQVGIPLVVKHPSGSQGDAVWKCNTVEELETVVEEHGQGEVPLIFQRYVRTSVGRDIRAFVIGGQLVGAYMRINSTSFKSNIHQGGVGRLINVQPDLEALVLRTAELCDLHIAGVDVMMDADDGTYKICECNSSPGFEGFERYSGLNVARSILSYVAATLALRKWNRLQQRRRERAKEFVRWPIQPEHLTLGLEQVGQCSSRNAPAKASSAVATPTGKDGEDEERDSSGVV